mmetsp:Transcript_91088/g.241927  ORF Transcript_91088/g.241927 Transcript_91088/m.241927 type:complete len:254 (+) Transcript_91088:93-854(+)
MKAFGPQGPPWNQKKAWWRPKMSSPRSLSLPSASAQFSSSRLTVSSMQILFPSTIMSFAHCANSFSSSECVTASFLKPGPAATCTSSSSRACRRISSRSAGLVATQGCARKIRWPAQAMSTLTSQNLPRRSPRDCTMWKFCSCVPSAVAARPPIVSSAAKWKPSFCHSSMYKRMSSGCCWSSMISTSRNLSNSWRSSSDSASSFLRTPTKTGDSGQRSTGHTFVEMKARLRRTSFSRRAFSAKSTISVAFHSP